VVVDGGHQHVVGQVAGDDLLFEGRRIRVRDSVASGAVRLETRTPRTSLLIVGVGLGIVLGIALAAGWLPGPRAGLPSVPATNAPSTDATLPPPTPRPQGLPDPARTPGSINPKATQDNLDETVCKPGWAATVRPPSAYTSALKFAQIIEYGYADRDPSHYQEDHLVPLELGGAPRDPRNLWPEPNVITLSNGSSISADAKDNLEDELHDQVCNGSMLLADAQRLIAGDWIDAWVASGRP
jgi:hypothetical protein